MTDTNDTPKPGAVDALRLLREFRDYVSAHPNAQGLSHHDNNGIWARVADALAAPHGQPAVDEAARCPHPSTRERLGVHLCNVCHEEADGPACPWEMRKTLVDGTVGEWEPCTDDTRKALLGHPFYGFRAVLAQPHAQEAAPRGIEQAFFSDEMDVASVDAQEAAPRGNGEAATGEPKVCPFCGGPAHVERKNYGSKTTIGCKPCRIYMSDKWSRVLSAWNRRTAPPAAQASDTRCFTCGNPKHDGACPEPKMCDRLLSRALRAERERDEWKEAHDISRKEWEAADNKAARLEAQLSALRTYTPASEDSHDPR